jgi:hypothetical protein
MPKNSRIPDNVRQPPKAWSRIGEAYRARGSKIKWAKFSEALDRLNVIYRAAQDGASYAAAEGLIGTDKKFLTIGDLLESPVGRLTRALNVLKVYSNDQAEARRVLTRAVDREGVSAKTLLGPELQAGDLGQRITEAVDRCVQCLKNARNNLGEDPLLEITVTLAEHAMDLLLAEFRRLGILRRCEYCGDVLFPSSAQKRFCSDSSEDRDCGHRAANKRSYGKLRATIGRMTRAESARKAARERWAKRAPDSVK